MNKILVSIEVPSIEKNFDLFIPINKKVGTIKKYIIQNIIELSGGIVPNENFSFCDIDTGVYYQNNVYVKDSGIKNGARIMII